MHKNFELCLRCRNPSSLDLKTRFIPFEACEALGRCFAEAGEGEMAFFAIDLSDSMLPNVIIKIIPYVEQEISLNAPSRSALLPFWRASRLPAPSAAWTSGGTNWRRRRWRRSPPWCRGTAAFCSKNISGRKEDLP